MTFQASDALNGGAGTDTLNITVGAAGTYQAQSIQNIEVVAATFSAGTAVSLLGVTGLTHVQLNGSTANGQFTNIGDATVAMQVSNTTSDADFSFTAAAVAGTSDTANVTLSGVSTGTALTINGATGNIETVALTSSGSANIIDSLTTTNATAVTVAGDQNLTITAGLDATVATLNASTLTGNLTATMGAVAAATITGGTGNDSVTISAVTGTVNVSSGAGNDTITAATNLTITDTINGGDGTDTLSSVFASVSTAGYTTPTTRTISNIETLRFSDAATGAFTTRGIDTSINKVIFAVDDSTNAAADATFAAGTSTLEIGTSTTTAAALSNNGVATTLAVSAYTPAAADGDSLTISNKNLSTADAFDDVAITSTEIETLTINSGAYATAIEQTLGALSITGSTGYTTAEKLVLTGANNVTFSGAITADIIDASGLTSTTGTTLTTVTGTTATTITGSGGNDVLVADTTSNVSISGGAGNDDITGGAGNDALLGDDGNDSITSGAGNDTITAGAGNDTIVMGDNFTSGDSIDGGDGTADTLSITSATTTGTINVVGGLALSAITTLNANLSNVERVTISDALVIDGASFDMARLDSINYLTLAANWTDAETIIGMAANSTVKLQAAATDGDDLTLTYADATGSADALTIALEAAANRDFGDVAIANIESLTVTTGEATASSNVRDFTLDMATTTGLTTLTITGTETLDIDGVAINATTINASGNTGFVKVLGGSANQSITGTAGADSIQAAGGADTIDGGAGDDALLSGGTGADSITGGAGADSISGGAGDDAIILTETTAAADTVLLDWSNVGADVDVITGFAKGSGADVIQIDISNFAAAGTSGIATSATAMALVGHATNQVAAANSDLLEMSGAAAAGATDSLFVLISDTFADTDAVEDALETGGSRQLTVVNGEANDQYTSFAVLYSDGTNAHLAIAYQTTADGAAVTYAAGSLKVVEIATLVGVTSIAAGTFAAADFVFV